jgi:hypothetical protein
VTILVAEHGDKITHFDAVTWALDADREHYLEGFRRAGLE